MFPELIGGPRVVSTESPPKAGFPRYYHKTPAHLLGFTDIAVMGKIQIGFTRHNLLLCKPHQYIFGALWCPAARRALYVAIQFRLSHIPDGRRDSGV